MHNNARKHMINQKKIPFLYPEFGCLQIIYKQFVFFRYLQHFRAEKLFIDAEEVKPVIIIALPQ